MNSQNIFFDARLQKAVVDELGSWDRAARTRDLWNRKAALWTNGDESRWLGWLTSAAREAQNLEEFRAAAALAKSCRDVVLLGMGGSSLSSEVLREAFGAKPGFPKMHVVDSLQPDQIRAVEGAIALDQTLFIVASKSGGTLESTVLMEYFWAKTGQKGEQFVAITDPDSPLHRTAVERRFRSVFLGDPEVGGRFSVLSKFGLIPAAMMGLDVSRFLGDALEMVAACGVERATRDNPGVVLGVSLAEAVRAGRDKVTFFCSEPIGNFGLWAEQLIAESTGKNGKGFIPVTGEVPGQGIYGDDRIFVHIKVTGRADGGVESLMSHVRDKGHPTVEIELKDAYGLGQEFFRWEMATAVAGACMGLHPFDQPDVESSKIVTKEFTRAFETKGRFDLKPPIARAERFDVYGVGVEKSDVSKVIQACLADLEPRDYVALLAYVPMEPEVLEALQKLRASIQKGRTNAVISQIGPRFLHSTGQVFKGGPDTGVFLQITTEPREDLLIPGRPSSFGAVGLAQALADFEVLTVQRKRRGIRFHIKGDLRAGLTDLMQAFIPANS